MHDNMEIAPRYSSNTFFPRWHTRLRSLKYRYMPVAPAAMPLPADARIIAATLVMVVW